MFLFMSLLSSFIIICIEEKINSFFSLIQTSSSFLMSTSWFLRSPALMGSSLLLVPELIVLSSV